MHIVSAKCMLPFSQFSPVNPDAQTQRYSLSVYPYRHLALFRQGLSMEQKFWPEKKNKNKKSG